MAYIRKADRERLALEKITKVKVEKKVPQSDVVYQGSLTKEGLKALCQTYFEAKLIGEPGIAKSPYNPMHNTNAISIIKQEDGNYKGWTQKGGTLIEVRDIGPETVLQKLLTHP